MATWTKVIKMELEQCGQVESHQDSLIIWIIGKGEKEELRMTLKFFAWETGSMDLPSKEVE